MSFSNFRDKFKHTYLYFLYAQLYNNYIDIWSRTIGIYFVELVGCLLLLFCFFAYAMIYKTTLIDPIETLKSAYISLMFITMLISLALTVLSILFSKSKESLILHLKIVLVITLLFVFIFALAKFSLDSTYNETKFSEMYTELDFSDFDTSKQYVDISITGVKLSEHKQVFIDENLKAYSYFKLKTTLGLILYCLLAGFNVYLISRFNKIQQIIAAIEQEDEVLFDEEENVKF